MPPVVTSWARVNGRNAISWEAKFALDVWCVENWSLGLHIRILAMTFSMVLKREGISQAREATREELMGRAG
jgi:sugar transferase EpsL